MALVTEDGTGKADAETYISVDDASAYHAKRGSAAWAALASDAIREQHLIKATDYMLQVYGQRWSGQRVSTAQALDWPRFNAPRREMGANVYWPSNVVPEAVKRACAELALRSIAGPLIPDLGQAVKSKKVDGLEIVYQDYSAATKTYKSVDDALAGFLGAGGGIMVRRA